MRCVKCLGGTLGEYQLPKAGVAIDRCDHCGGIWFDPGELEVILGPSAMTPFIFVSGSGYNDDYVCPRCDVPLAEFHYPGTSTLIDACEKCHGIWLDNKEWNDIKQCRSGKSKLAS